MQTLDRDNVSAHVAGSPEQVYDLVADVTRMPQLSPEILRCVWLDGVTGPALGARFEATNKAGRGPAWKNRPVITSAERGRELAFTRTEKFAGSINWRYRFTPDGDGTRVTESYEVIEPVTRLGWFVIDKIYGRHDRRHDLHQGMLATLERINALLTADTDG